ncbi:YheC/YheD family protein [Paenibacillus validus]|uniref:YheC/YheD family endospore coat-associated protein n=3 Tax=Paenibacillus validus TaxID=44253 RepID=UPI001FD10027|nr:YheC/YheD family protein [Paenibacillus validus]
MMIFGKNAGGERTVGIMTTPAEYTPPFENRGFYRRLCLLGPRLHLSVYVFTPNSVDWEQERVTGYTYEASAGQWVPGTFALPAIVYDRCFFTTRRQYADYRETMGRLQRHPNVRLLGSGLKGKLDVQRLLARDRDGRFNRYLPQTELLRSMRMLADWLREHGEAVLKPLGGSQGRGVLHVRRNAEPGGQTPAFTLRGRDARNREIARGFESGAALAAFLRRLIGRRSYLLQRYLALHTREGDAYDVRALVQKNGAGRWQLTGLAVRRGQSGSLTANLHGGGMACAAEPMLAREFGRARAEAILAELRQLADTLPEVLESRHGRLAELGIDFGVDTGGHIWMLEVNSKPGRSIFTYLRDDKARLAAVANPLRYADYLLRQTAAAPARSFSLKK